MIFLEAFVPIFANLVIKGVYTIDTVPEVYRDKVKTEVERRKAAGLIY